MDIAGNTAKQLLQPCSFSSTMVLSLVYRVYLQLTIHTAYKAFCSFKAFQMEGEKWKSAEQKHAHMIGLTKAITSCLDDRNDVSRESDAVKVKEFI